MIRAPQALSLDDLERLAHRYGGTIEAHPSGWYKLVGALIAGKRVDLGPVRDDGRVGA